ncbi:phosphohydrolase [Hahella sp. CCB-MM4]|uniref:MSMEG_1061 family FMN-dependent PPOX-type flavoprotein n=1 Tax=Hahella sp. (strain CCB-MM4) TaxID=1926491 RepID=UPI000B9A34B1|nr:MSMEG_1061 family FMN-dependent PPOX-type flavoprotein [Hahella sp. CCB-MM4]OZG69906.1 phosphohydrolase [Hahella sp. CCB-MM4]
MYIDSEEKLRELYGFPKGRAKDKQIPKLEKHSTKFISLSPFVLVSTYGKDGKVDCSPRGGKPGFVELIGNDSLLIPDSKGNNRLDSHVNILETEKIGCLFMIPGVDETLRVNGEAKISILPDHLSRFQSWSNPPKSCIEVKIEEVFLHCAKAFMRSRLWHSDSKIERSILPTMGRMINDQLLIDGEPESQEQMIERYNKDL